MSTFSKFFLLRENNIISNALEQLKDEIDKIFKKLSEELKEKDDFKLQTSVVSGGKTTPNINKFPSLVTLSSNPKFAESFNYINRVFDKVNKLVENKILSESNLVQDMLEKYKKEIFDKIDHIDNLSKNVSKEVSAAQSATQNDNPKDFNINILKDLSKKNYDKEIEESVDRLIKRFYKGYQFNKNIKIVGTNNQEAEKPEDITEISLNGAKPNFKIVFNKENALKAYEETLEKLNSLLSDANKKIEGKKNKTPNFRYYSDKIKELSEFKKYVTTYIKNIINKGVLNFDVTKPKTVSDAIENYDIIVGAINNLLKFNKKNKRKLPVVGDEEPLPVKENLNHVKNELALILVENNINVDDFIESWLGQAYAGVKGAVKGAAQGLNKVVEPAKQNFKNEMGKKRALDNLNYANKQLDALVDSLTKAGLNHDVLYKNFDKVKNYIKQGIQKINDNPAKSKYKLNVVPKSTTDKPTSNEPVKTSPNFPPANKPAQTNTVTTPINKTPTNVNNPLASRAKNLSAFRSAGK